MENFDRNNFLDKMNQEFKRTDEFYMNCHQMAFVYLISMCNYTTLNLFLSKNS
jgi:hypothetical protein